MQDHVEIIIAAVIMFAFVVLCPLLLYKHFHNLTPPPPLPYLRAYGALTGSASGLHPP